MILKGDASSPVPSVRLDLWAWSVRLYRTRALAAAACQRSQLLVNGQRCRAARPVRVGDEVRVRQGPLERTLEVTGLLRRRVGPKEVGGYLRDLTPPEEYARVAAQEREARAAGPIRKSGAGRPTKRERRELEGLAEEEPGESSPDFEDFVKAVLRRRPPR